MSLVRYYGSYANRRQWYDGLTYCTVRIAPIGTPSIQDIAIQVLTLLLVERPGSEPDLSEDL